MVWVSINYQKILELMINLFKFIKYYRNKNITLDNTLQDHILLHL